ncbi:ABC transporter permease [Halopenitus sp. H-Gu1]|uniref:ABC transporter permease n=1 Tax=Halopenitus sp. H-Gu1 TaxID=3242697 RepID=UPI00359E27BE
MALETTRYSARRRVRGSIAMAILLGAFALLIIYIYPSFAEASADIDALMESLPESFREGMGVESYSTIEGFVAAELYQFLWILLLGLYMAYIAGETFSDDIESKRLYLVLSTPISRSRFHLETTLALLTPLIILNVVIPLVVFGGTIAIDYPVDPYYLAAVHLLSVPYHLVCMGIGAVLSVTFVRGNTAELSGISIVFLLFLLDSVTVGSDFERLGAISPTRYIDPTEILLHETLAVGDALILLSVALLLIFGSMILFQNRDI